MEKLGESMNEKIYKLLHLVGSGNITIGVVVMVIGLTAGILSIVAGAKLLKEKQNIVF